MNEIENIDVLVELVIGIVESAFEQAKEFREDIHAKDLHVLFHRENENQEFLIGDFLHAVLRAIVVVREVREFGIFDTRVFLRAGHALVVEHPDLLQQRFQR